MSIPGSASPLLLASTAAAAGGYQVSRSLRFNSADSAYLSRTPAVAGNRTKWTWAGWLKRSELGRTQFLFCGGPDTANDTDQIQIFFQSNDTLRINSQDSVFRETTQVFRDVSAWYHFVIAVDTTIASPANDRIKFYVNGSQVTTFNITVNPTQNANTGINATTQHTFGRSSGAQYTSSAFSFSGYLAETYLIDGQSLDHTSFTEVSATTGQLIPKTYSGSYGTNGFQLKFADNSSNTAATLGKDTSGNSNNWTPNNLSVTAGVGNDSLVDTPTSFGTDTSVGGEVRGNYCTLNPLNSGGSGTPTLTNGNLDFSLAPSVGAIGTHAMGSIAVTAGKYYWEVNLTSNYLNAIYIGLMRGADYNTYHNTSSGGVLYFGYSGDKAIDGVFTSYGNSYTNNDIIGIALDVDAGTVTFYKNNSSQGVITLPSSTSGWKAYLGNGSSGGTQAGVSNFGQRPFAYTAPSGFKALCDTNLGAPVVAKPNTLMDVKLYTGNGSTQTISGLAFSPDLVWLKSRSSGGYAHRLNDTVREATKELYSNLTSAEFTDASGLTAFNSDGFSVGSTPGYNENTGTYVAWAWDAGTSTVSNTAGSITSQVRANVSAGFSVATWSSGSGGTVGHGLGVAPSLIIAKARTGTSQWIVYHSATGVGGYLYLSATSAVGTNIANVWSPVSSTVFNVNNGLFPTPYDYVSYHFAPVVGYSSAFSYTGNGDSSGPFVYLGFRPRFVIQKRTDSAGSWLMIDTARDPVNVARNELFANSSAAEYDNTSLIDVLSNGFKIRATFANMNASGGSFIGYAFAENPFQYARAR